MRTLPDAPPIRRTEYHHRRLRARLPRPGKLVWVVVLLLVALPAAGLGIGWVTWKRIPRAAVTPLPPPGNVETVLLVGSDSRQDLQAESSGQFGGAKVGGQRADTIMLLVLPPGHGRAPMLSLPRDLRVTVGGRTGKLNGAYNQGPQGIIEAVRSVTGMDVNHFVEVNFDGFRDLSAAAGGVNICVDAPVRDEFSNLNLPAGCHDLAGDQALAWVRSRHLEKLQGDRWVKDPLGDISRIKRQQEFMKKLAAELAGPGTLAHFPSLMRATDDFRIDPGFSYWHALRLAYRFGLNHDVAYVTLPAVPRNIRGVSYMVADDAKAGPVLADLRAGKETPPQEPAK